ncbi:MAG: hypothetical protein IJI53_06680 [Clostridia bacterium]|nr:hypothetical protein [Clostridia bacterium]
MDIASIGAALAVTGGAAAAANEAATNANNKATAANNAATAANNAAAAAAEAAEGYPNLDKDAMIDRTAFNYAYMLIQAELRDLQKRLATAEAQLRAMT